MSTTIDQKAYLQKYLSGTSGDKKKKKKKVAKGKGFKIIDDDIDVSKIRPLDGDELDILGEGEDAPQVAGIIDERPEEVRKLEQFKVTSKWRVINQDDGFNSKLQIEEIQKDVKEAEQENELIFGKMYSDSEDDKKNDSDLSPPRKGTEKSKTKKPQNNSDSDLSPPRKNKEQSPKRSKNKGSDDRLPPRKQANEKPTMSRKPQNDNDSDISPPRKNRQPSPKKSKNKAYGSDHSPPRHESQKRRERARKPSRWGDFEEEKRRQRSLERQSKIKSDSDVSPPRKSRKDSPKGRNKSPDSDLSPPRKKNKSPDRKDTKKYQNKHNTDIKDRHGKTRRKSSDSDLSPPRKKTQKSSRKSRKETPERKRKHDSDSDLSPPRKSKEYKRTSDSPPPTNRKMAKTLEGKLAGLQDATQLRQENEAFRRREAEVFSKMTDEVSGRNAKAVSRKGKRETSEDRQKQKDKAERQKELDEKYKKWSKGLKQIEAQEARLQDYLHEASKPLARHRGDRDLEDQLKAVERAGDPMLQYIQERKRERGEIGPEKPVYKGQFPPNRFNIRPGYRWDGVDRSNGYEKKFFDQQSKKKAMEEEAYKWSTEDL